MSTDTVQHGVEGLTYLLTESSKLLVRAPGASVHPPDLREVQRPLHRSPGGDLLSSGRREWFLTDLAKPRLDGVN